RREDAAVRRPDEEIGKAVAVQVARRDILRPENRGVRRGIVERAVAVARINIHRSGGGVRKRNIGFAVLIEFRRGDAGELAAAECLWLKAERPVPIPQQDLAPAGHEILLRIAVEFAARDEIAARTRRAADSRRGE